MPDHHLPLAGKVAVVTGGSSGIGAAAARHFAAAGAHVAVVASRDVAKAQGVVATLPGGGHQAYAADVADTRGAGRGLPAMSARRSAVSTSW